MVLKFLSKLSNNTNFRIMSACVITNDKFIYLAIYIHTLQSIVR